MTTTMTSTMEAPVKNLEANYTSHPSELVKGGEVNSKYTSQDLRNAIPAHCFKPSYFWSFFYLARDLLVSGTLMYAAYSYIPQIELPLARWVAWAAYGYVQGQQMTGIWMGKYASLMGIDVEHIEEMAEDSPLYTFARMVFQQIVGFPWYLTANITATQGSLANKNPPSKYPLGNSHFLPTSALFRPEEWHLILASDIGIGLTMLGIWYASTIVGGQAVALLYVMPYMWVNHWIVAITYLHHTHPDIPKYEPEAWTFLKGATATVDRGLGFGGKHLMHNIADYHVIHHIFSRIPQYYAEEATKAIMPLLGDSYHEDKERSFWYCMWESFTQCQYVVPDDPTAKPENRAMYYKGGPSPPIEISMGRGGLKME
ncbi:hypothetical protein P7C71_g4701, partial [Lecanoromycetidae sp. Uapishka_2]